MKQAVCEMGKLPMHNPMSEKKDKVNDMCPSCHISVQCPRLAPPVTEVPPENFSGRPTYYDVMVLHRAATSTEAMQLCYILEQVVLLKDLGHPSVRVFSMDAAEMLPTILDNLEHCSSVLMVCSGADGGVVKRVCEEVVVRCLQQPRRHLVPVAVNTQHSAPVGMRALRPLKLYRLYKDQALSMKELEIDGAEALDKYELQALTRLAQASADATQLRKQERNKRLAQVHLDSSRRQELQQAIHQGLRGDPVHPSTS